MTKDERINLVVKDKRLNFYDIEHAIVAQTIYTSKNKLPRYVPGNGICTECSGQIYDRITVGYAASKVIRKCPHCQYSFLREEPKNKDVLEEE